MRRRLRRNDTFDTDAVGLLLGTWFLRHGVLNILHDLLWLLSPRRLLADVLLGRDTQPGVLSIVQLRFKAVGDPSKDLKPDVARLAYSSLRPSA